MARKTGKPQDNPLPEQDRKELLDELSSVQDMLSEEDAAAGPDEDPPVLEPDTPDDPATGQGEEQMPLLQPESDGESGDPANERLRQALSERPNPFLKDAARKTSAKSAAPESSAQPAPSTEQDKPATGKPTTSAPPTEAGNEAAPGGTPLTEEQMRALVDETLAAWLPKIERELRDKLMERLRNQQG